MVHNQPYDESLEVSDGEEIASTNATPRGLDQTGMSDYTPGCAHTGRWWWLVLTTSRQK